MERSKEFEELVKQAYQLNSECLTLTKKFSNVVYFTSERQIEIPCPKRLTFEPCENHGEENQNVFILRFPGGKQEERLNLLKKLWFDQNPEENESSSWKNPLRTPLPRFVFKDLGEELKLYEVLDPVKGFEILKGFVEGLRRVHEELQERDERVKLRIGLAKRLFDNLNVLVQDSEEEPKKKPSPQQMVQEPIAYFRRKEYEPFMKILNLRMEIELTNERAMADVDLLQEILTRYFEQIQNLKQTADHEVETLVQESKIVTRKENKQLLLKWLREKENESVIKTQLLYRATRDGSTAESFNRRCVNKGKTLILVRCGGALGRDRVIGGFANVSWSGTGDFVEDVGMKSFVFSLDEREKWDLLQGRSAIRGWPPEGTGLIQFGNGGSGFYLRRNGEKVEGISDPSYRTYTVPPNFWIGGTQTFQVSDFECWAVNDRDE
eukprot:TRINITY_DN3857_c0_g1_i1.p1 TRINITY_DN3857_c0_g1~~TRINITY_DN3857_c0_g1_i1.p1  ORF type:complete len:454 (+),score=116.68 TRINITY_DN3857_c0_g1_i1:54-1364(+)